MSDCFYPLSLEHLYRFMIHEREHLGTIFGIHDSLFFRPRIDDRFRMERYGRLLETPIGVAAGPHTQLAQNIVAAWLCGARYLELKTVQTLDELSISRPCIDMVDEGYNCEWSQELRLDESLDAYADAFVLIEALRKILGFEGDEPGFLFNMSVGYSMEGILKPNVQRFLDRMTQTQEILQRKANELAARFPDFPSIAVPEQVSDNVTLSTMHGCPPDEIEKIGLYLIEERKLHTTIKLNPTLLGRERLREILNGRLGYDIEVPDEAFAHDIAFPAACDLITSLMNASRRAGVHFNIKLTNTLEVVNTKGRLPQNEAMIYMSGRALHPLSVHVAEMLQERFDGALDLSFSAGADCFNVSKLLGCGIRPVTTCSDILKPGGYTRLRQYLDEIDRTLHVLGAASLDELIVKTAGTGNLEPASGTFLKKAALQNLKSYAHEVLEDPRYHQDMFPFESIKIPRPLTQFDCVSAPCRETCPIHQDAPSYLRCTADGHNDDALGIICADNSMPAITGMICDHTCQSKCTRINLDEPLAIREVKRFHASRSQPAAKTILPNPQAPTVAIIGAGPSGLACAKDLLQAGCSVSLFEEKSFAGGMIADVIPRFRLDQELMERDIDAILADGATITYNRRIDREAFVEIQRSFSAVYIAVGAQISRKLGLAHENASGVIDQLRFLSTVREGTLTNPGPRIAVIGGGNSCMDAARTAKRLVGDNGDVIVVYRRTRKEMPADEHEIRATLSEGIQLMELTAPISINVDAGKVVSLGCIAMKLTTADASGRPRPIPIEGTEFDLPVDTIISALGQDVVLDFLPDGQMQVDPTTCRTELPNVYAGGDAIRGASTLIRAMADGKRAARRILAESGISIETPRPASSPLTDLGIHQRHLAHREYSTLSPQNQSTAMAISSKLPRFDSDSIRKEAARCLACHEICNVCVSVCPNRANVAVPTPRESLPIHRISLENGTFKWTESERLSLKDHYQIINIRDFCNECGNCVTFCPTAGEPFKDKIRITLTDRCMLQREDTVYSYRNGTLVYHQNGERETLTVSGDNLRFTSAQIDIFYDLPAMTIRSCNAFSMEEGDTLNLYRPAEMFLVYRMLMNCGIA